MLITVIDCLIIPGGQIDTLTCGEDNIPHIGIAVIYTRDIIVFSTTQGNPKKLKIYSHTKAALSLSVCWSLTSLCHSNGHIETMPAREINPFTALTMIRSQFLRTH